MPNIFGALSEVYGTLPINDAAFPINNAALKQDVIDALIEFERSLADVGSSDRLLGNAQSSFEAHLLAKLGQRLSHVPGEHDLAVVSEKVRDLSNEYARLVRQTFAGSQNR